MFSLSCRHKYFWYILFRLDSAVTSGFEFARNKIQMAMKHKCTVIYYVDSARSVTVSVERFSGCQSRERQRQQTGLRLELNGVRFELSGVRLVVSRCGGVSVLSVRVTIQ